jgi:acyl-CoA synthetase (AMP-forming)/AMP-acid ligase II
VSSTRRDLADLLFDGDAGTPVVYWRDREWTRAEMAGAADALAVDLRAAGAGPGRAVGELLPTAPVGIVMLFGGWRAGAVGAPINPRLPDPEQQRLLGDIAPVAVVRAAGEPGSLDVRVDNVVAEPRDYGSGAALVMSTSGTTGPPKRVLLDHASTFESIDSAIGNIRGRRQTGATGSSAVTGLTTPTPAAGMPNLVPVPLALWAGIYNVLFAFRAAAPIVLLEPFDPLEFVSIVSRHRLRSTVLAPAMMTMLADDRRVTSLEPLRFVRSISSPLSPHEARRFHDRFGVTVLNSYGQTELGGQIAGWNAEDAREFGEAKLGAVGRPIAGVSARIRAADGADVSQGGTGEIWVRSPFMMRGYASDDHEFDARVDDEGYLRTGDIGRIDEDGFIWVEGRVSDAINRGGLKVFPADVEEVLRRDSAVADVCVAGVPDRRLGEVPWAFIVPATGATPDPERLVALCREQLAAYAVPVRFETVTELPRNEVGKVLRRVLAERALATRGGP